MTRWTFGIALGFLSAAAVAAGTPKVVPAPAPLRDGQHDFDYDFGTWKTHTRRLVKPLTGSSTWIELDGVHTVRKLWNGKANLAELEMDGPNGHLESLSLRLYDPAAHQWSVNFVNSKVGTFGAPLVGQFKNGRGEFYDQETFDGRTILVRFIFESVTPDSARSEQAFSVDGGKTWEVNWLNTDVRMKDGPLPVPPPDGIQHDFDFEIGTWKVHIVRRQRPLTGSDSWSPYDGTWVVRKVWNGRANLVELEADGPAGHLEGLGLRLWNPEAKQWSLNWVNSSQGTLGVPTVGELKNGRGEFYDQETYEGRAIFIRNIWSDLTATSSKFDQAFSADGGKTWESNWVSTNSKVRDDQDGTSK